MVKKLVEWDYKTGQIKVNFEMIMIDYFNELKNSINIWNEIAKNDIKFSSKVKLNKTKTLLEEAELYIKSKLTKSFLVIKLTQKGDKIKIKFLKMNITSKEKEYFKRHSKLCLFYLHYLIYNFYINNAENLTKEGKEKFKKETTLLKSLYEKL